MKLIHIGIIISILMLVATSAQAAAVSDLLPTTNTATLTGATFHALKSTPDGRPALIFRQKNADGTDKLVYWEREAGGQWRTEEIAGAAGSSPVSGLFGEYRASWSGLFFTPAGDPIVINDNGSVFSRTNGAWAELPLSGSFPWLDGQHGMAAMGPDGSLHTLSTGGLVGNLSYGYLPLPGTTWQSTPLTAFAATNYYHTFNEPRFLSMVIDVNNKVHATFVPEFQNTPVAGGADVRSELWYLTNKSGTWQTSRIYGLPAGGYGDAGLGASIALRPDGQPAVASIYVSRAATGSSYAESLLLHELGSNGVWTSSTVASSTDGYIAGDGARGTGFAPHLLYDPLGRPHIAFTDFASQHMDGGQEEFGGNLRHAWRDGSTWRLTTVFRQTSPLSNQLFWPNMMLLSGSAAILGEISRDTWSPYLSRSVGLVFTEFVPSGLQTARLTVVKAGTGGGSVTSTPAGLVCTDTCSTNFFTGSNVTLTARAASNSSFAGWSGCDSTSGNTCTINVTTDRSVSASWSVIPGVIMTQNFDDVTPPAVPAGWQAISDGYATWATNESGTSHSGANLVFFNGYYTYSGGSAVLVSPVFSLAGITGGKVKFWMYRDSLYRDPYYPDKVDVYQNSVANLTGSPTLLGTVNRDTALAPPVSADGWYQYSFDLPGSGTTNYIIFKATRGGGKDIYLDDITVRHFAPQTLTVSLPGSGSGTVTSTAGVTPQLSCASPNTGCTASVDHGESVTLWATATVGSTFSGWAGACSGVPCTFTMDGNKTAAATFNKLKYLKNETTGAYFGTLQSALGEAKSGETVRALAIQMLDTGITFNTGLTPILFRGGYTDLADAAPSGYTTLDGPFRISDGTLKVDRLKIK